MKSTHSKYTIFRLGPLGLLEHNKTDGSCEIIYRGPYAEAQKLLKQIQKGETIPKQEVKRAPPALDMDTE